MTRHVANVAQAPTRPMTLAEILAQLDAISKRTQPTPAERALNVVIRILEKPWHDNMAREKLRSIIVGAWNGQIG